MRFLGIFLIAGILILMAFSVTTYAWWDSEQVLEEYTDPGYRHLPGSQPYDPPYRHRLRRRSHNLLRRGLRGEPGV